MSSAAILRANLLTHFGPGGRHPCALTYRLHFAGPYDKRTGGVRGPDFDTDYDGWGRVGNYADKLIDGQMIQRGDRLVTFIPDDLTVDVTIGGTLIRGDDNFRVIDVKKRELEAELICYSLQVRNV